MNNVKQLVGGVKDGVGCIFGILVVPVVLLTLLLALVKLGDILFPEDPELRVRQCSKQKQSFQRAMFCESVYAIGEQFLNDPTSTYVCSDSEVSQTISSRSFLFKFRLDSCNKDDAKLYSDNVLQHILQSQVTFSECEKGFDGRNHVPEVQKQFDAFLACRRYRTSP